jgi:hypothetical protein
MRKKNFLGWKLGQVRLILDNSGCEPLTPDDIAEVVVFVAGRRQNVVIADTMIYPSHQVSKHGKWLTFKVADEICHRLALVCCTRSRHKGSSFVIELEAYL